MVISVAFQDGFEGDTVVVEVDGVEAYRAEGLTTRTQLSHAGDTKLDVPERPFSLQVAVPTRDVADTLTIDPAAQPNVAISLRDGRIVASFPERLGFA